MVNSRYFEPRLLVVALAVVGLVAFGPSCSSSDKGGKGGEGGNVGAEICDNELDDDANGKVDCEDDACLETEHCCPTCGKECGESGQSVCATSISGTVRSVCSPDGSCEPAGLVNADGSTRTGWSLVMSKMAEINPTMNYSAEQLLVLSSDRPNTTEKATCNAIMAREIDAADPSQVNVVYEATPKVEGKGDYIPAPAWPVPLPKEGQKLLAVVRFYASKDLNNHPRGDIMGEGCAEFDSIREGEYEDGHEGDPAYQWEVIIHLYCGGYLNRQCPEPKTCVVGLCLDTRCGTCGPGYTCREWEGEPDCRKACNPDQPDCPNLHRCDATPGEPAVCVPVAQ